MNKPAAGIVACEHWHLPRGVHIAMTTRHGGCSAPPYQSLNLGLHVGDDRQQVLTNRQTISERLQLPGQPTWLDQVHGVEVLSLSHLTTSPSQMYTADASYTNEVGQVCVVMTADCLPVLLCNKAGTEVAAVHAGWRGLCDGVIEAAIAKFSSPPSELVAYLGPAIGPAAFQVGSEVYEGFTDHFPCDAQHFKPDGDRYLADIQGLAFSRLRHAGVFSYCSVDTCTYQNSKDFFSFRRDGVTGRMASFIWLNT